MSIKPIHEEIIARVSEQIKTALARHIGHSFDKQKLLTACKSMLSATYECRDIDVKFVEESEEEKIVREVMEEPDPGIVVQTNIELAPMPIQYLSIKCVVKE